MDLAVIGKGPAGWSCAMTARMRGLSVVVIAPEGENGWLGGAERIDNYPGLPHISGGELLERFRRQALSLGAEERDGLARQLTRNGDGFLLLVENDVLECRAVVLAMGAARPVLLPGEEECLGRGVSYCATCDGMLYRGRRLAVLSGCRRGVEETTFLSGLAASVDYFPLKPHETNGLPESVTLVTEKPRGVARGAAGEMELLTDRQTRLYDGVFIFRAAVPLHMLMEGLAAEGGSLVVDRGMRTSEPGVFAAGDITGKPLQIAKATGEGNIAALSAAEYLAKLG